MIKQGSLFAVALSLLAAVPAQATSRIRIASNSEDCASRLIRAATTEVPFELPGLRVASLEDPSGSTGATLFYFPRGAYAQYDARGGSVASSETTLLDQGSYSNQIDAIVFAGGSTMGLAAGDGVRSVIFEQRAQNAGDFDFIPSVPSAVVYDYGNRPYAGQRQLAYPDHELGRGLMARLSSQFTVGRAGAGTSTTVNKIGDARWGGQGAAFADTRYGRVFVAVVLNAGGDVIQGESSYSQKFPTAEAQAERARGSRPKQNTTLSIVVTDAPLSRNQLKRLSTQLHTSMARSIWPFHTYTDGDINFAVSTGNPDEAVNEEVEEGIAQVAVDLMKDAILKSVRVSNQAEPISAGPRP